MSLTEPYHLASWLTISIIHSFNPSCDVWVVQLFTPNDRWINAFAERSMRKYHNRWHFSLCYVSPSFPFAVRHPSFPSVGSWGWQSGAPNLLLPPLISYYSHHLCNRLCNASNHRGNPQMSRNWTVIVLSSISLLPKSQYCSSVISLKPLPTTPSTPTPNFSVPIWRLSSTGHR